MKYFFLIASLFLIPATSIAQDSAKAAPQAAKKTPFYKMYPTNLAPAAEIYFRQWNNALFKKGPIAEKHARLAAISASVAMKCEYCITAQVMIAKALGATDEEIKTAIQIAAEVGRFSLLLYGNEFGQEKLKTIVETMLKKPAKK